MFSVVYVLLLQAHRLQLKGVFLVLEAEFVLFEFGIIVDGLDGFEEIDLVLEIGVGLEFFKFFGTFLSRDVE